MNFAQFGETQRLRKLIIGRCEGYRATAAYEEIVNEEQRKGLPTEETLKPEFAAFRAALEAEGVEVLLPDFIRDHYEWIEVSKAEQAALATNVLSIDEQTLISRAHPVCRRVNEELRQAGLRVIELPFDGAPRTGGAFRCCSLPLVRGNTQKADQEQS